MFFTYRHEIKFCRDKTRDSEKEKSKNFPSLHPSFQSSHHHTKLMCKNKRKYTFSKVCLLYRQNLHVFKRNITQRTKTGQEFKFKYRIIREKEAPSFFFLCWMKLSQWGFIYLQMFQQWYCLPPFCVIFQIFTMFSLALKSSKEFLRIYVILCLIFRAS
jgi:hypothetical protein